MNVLSDGNVRARKKHVCDWCSETIKQGEVYWSCSYADGGEITTLYRAASQDAVD